MVAIFISIPQFHRWLGVAIYWILIFTVTVILLTLLVAQFYHTYFETHGQAQCVVTLTRSKLLYRMEYDSNYLQQHIIKVCQVYMAENWIKIILISSFQWIKKHRCNNAKLQVRREMPKGMNGKSTQKNTILNIQYI